MRRLLFFVLCLIQVNAWAGSEDWYVTRDRNGFSMLVYRYNINLRISLIADPAHTRLVDIKPHSIFKHIEVVRYQSANESSRQMLLIERAVLFNTRTHRILGDFPLRITSTRSGPDQQPRQPKWKHDAKSLHIFDPETRQTTVLPMN